MNQKKDLFSYNLKKLFDINPELAQKIVYLGEPKHLTFVNTDKGELNLSYHHHEDSFLLHDSKGAIKELSPKWDDKNLSKELFYIFGVGLGYDYLFLEKEIKKNPYKRIVFFEKDLGVLFRLFQTELGKKIMDSKNVEIVHFEQINEIEKEVDRVNNQNLLLELFCTALPSYQTHFSSLCEKFLDFATVSSTSTNAGIAEILSSSSDFFYNFIFAMLEIDKAHNAHLLKNKFKNIPGIICGAGPSLKKQLPMLKKLKDRSIILGGSSTVSALSSEFFFPHFAGYLDPYPRLYDRMLSNYAFASPTFCSSRPHHLAMKALHAPKLYVKGSSNNPICEYLENELKIRGHGFTEMASITGFLTQIAIMLGLNPIIYVGVDLAYTNDQSYSGGVVSLNSSDDDANLKQTQNVKIATYDIYQNPIMTNTIWVRESQMLKSLVEFHPDIQFINSTEGGLGIKSVRNLSLSQVSEDFLQKFYPLDGKVHVELLNTKFKHITKNSSVKILKEILKSLKTVKKIYISIIHELEKMQEKKDYSVFKNSNIEKYEKKFLKELAFQKFLYFYTQCYSKVSAKQEMEIERKKAQVPESEYNFMKQELYYDRVDFATFTTERLITLLEEGLSNHKPSND